MGPSCIFCLLFVLFFVHRTSSTPVSSKNWELMESTDGIKFSPRNAHASCVFKGYIWVTGGRTDAYVMYNLLESFKVADVWKSKSGNIWEQEEQLTGDFFAQNIDVVQPGPIAPWYQRYGHTLDPVDIDGDGEDDLMVQLGGYASSPSNDMWVTADGTEWIYCGLAPWTPRAWHSTTIFNGSLWLMGGTPLNNEVWRLDNVTRVNNRTQPLTRSMYSDHTYDLQWTRMPDAPWSPRVGAGLLSQYYFNTAAGEHKNSSSRERMVLAGGYGGWLESQPDEVEYRGTYDGFYCRSDTWQSYDGLNWTMLSNTNAFGGRAWFGMNQLRGADPRDDPYNHNEPPKMYIFGGGYIGFSTSSIKIVSEMVGKADGYWSRDGINWVKINYEEGGGTTTIPFFSSQEWTETIVDTNTKYLGLWGLTVETFNLSTLSEYPGEFFLIAGDFTGAGDFTSDVYKSLDGIFCDINGAVCSGVGTCGTGGCVCPYGTYGDRCQYGKVTTPPKAGAMMGAQYLNVFVHMGVLLMASLWLSM